jgi:histone deacetylase HOS3
VLIGETIGNGTQSIVWQINEETYRTSLEDEASESSSRSSLQVYYGSMHDILSYPCEVCRLALADISKV